MLRPTPVLDPRTVRAVLLACAGALAACAMPHAPHGHVPAETFQPHELLQNTASRVTTLAMRDNLTSLWLLLDKLYRRNPGEWKKTATSRAAAVAQVRAAVHQREPWPALEGARGVEALSKALQPAFEGDRAAAFVYAAADMIIQAHGDKVSFTLIDSPNPQAQYNAARNIEIATWILNTRKTSTGAPLLLANHLTEQERNLSFEREMGKIIARLDLLASAGTERYRRAAIDYGQSLMVGPLLGFLPVR